MSFKRTKVVMLPTNEKAKVGDLMLQDVVLIKAYYDSNWAKAQHLYFLSDDEIKEGDWCYDEYNKVIFQNNSSGTPGASKKIIATTDKLRVITEDEFNGVDNQHLPQPSKGFILKFAESYNRGNPITEVMVEYNEGQCHKTICDDNCSYPNCFEQGELKVNPKDNTIIIKKAKDTWTRDEVVNLLQQFNNDKSGAFDCSKWIEENL